MRERRGFRGLIGPSIAAMAIVAVLLCAEHVQRTVALRFPQLRLAPLASNALGSATGPSKRPSGADRSPAGVPRLLSVETDPAGHDPLPPRELEVAPERPAKGKRGESAKGESASGELRSSGSPESGARLAAPRRPERGELAGWAPPIDSTGQASWQETRGTGLGMEALAREAERGAGPWAQSVVHRGENATVHASTAQLDRPLEPSFVAGRLVRDSGVPSVHEPLHDAQRRTDEPRRSRLRPTAWPVATALEADLQRLSAAPEAAAWTEAVRQRLRELAQLPRLSDGRAGPLLEELSKLADLGLTSAEASTDRSLQLQWLRTAHAVGRRSRIWDQVWRVADQPTAQLVAVRSAAAAEIPRVMHEVRQRAAATGDGEAWQRYLLLDEVERVAAAGDSLEREMLAHRLLSRLQWEGLEDAQRQWIQSDAVQQLGAVVRPWAARPIDYAALLTQLERQESDAVDLGGIEVAAASQTLRLAGTPVTAEVADSLGTFYRNANLRVAVSDHFLRQLLPEVPMREAPVRQTILGMPVQGASRVQSQLDLRFEPHPYGWRIQLATLGRIDSQTASRRGPVRTRNDGSAEFAAATLIEIDRHGARVGGTHVDLASQNRLRNLETDFDVMPVFGSLVRSIALSQYEQMKTPARRQSEQLIRGEIQQQVSAEVQRHVSEASQKLSERLIGPLARLQLDPQLVDMNSTERRLTARYRIAGEWQLAAFTPRPRAPADSLLSVQVHQSVMNNLVERLAPCEGPQPIHQLSSEILDLFGCDPAMAPQDVPEDVMIQFATTRPVTVEIEDGELWLTLRVVRLMQPGALDLSHFIVRAAYRPEVEGMDARLVRHGPLRISGPRLGMRERLPVRAIFTKVLHVNRPLPLTGVAAGQPAGGLDGVAVTQLELRDGWIGLALGPAGRPPLMTPRRLPEVQSDAPEPGEEETLRVRTAADRPGLHR